MTLRDVGELALKRFGDASVKRTVWTSNYVASNGDAARDLSAQFLALAEKHDATGPLLIAHRIMGISLATTGHIARGRAHFDRAFALYAPAEHRALATRFSVDAAMSILSYRSWTIWVLGYPEAALADADNALKIARDIGQASTLMYALVLTSYTLIHCGNYAAASVQTNELAELADEKGSPFWLAFGRMNRGCIWALTGKLSDGVQMLTNAINAHRSTGARHFLPWYLSILSCDTGPRTTAEGLWGALRALQRVRSICGPAPQPPGSRAQHTLSDGGEEL